MRSEWWLLGLAGVAFLGVAAPLYVGVALTAGELYAGPIAFGLGWAVHRVVAGRKGDSVGLVYHDLRSTPARVGDYLVVAAVTVPVGVGVAVLAGVAVVPAVEFVDDPILLSEPLAMVATLIVSGLVFRYRRPDYEGKTVQRTPTGK